MTRRASGRRPGSNNFRCRLDTLELRRMMASDTSVSGDPAFDPTGTDLVLLTTAFTQPGDPAEFTNLSTSFSTTASAAPAAPVITVAQAGDGRARVTWSAPQTTGAADLIGYRLQVSFNGADWSAVDRTVPIPADATTATVNHLAPGGSHRFRVTALYDDGSSADSADSDGVLVQTAPVAVGRFAAPVNVTATGGDRSVSVSWSPVVGPLTGYTIETSTDGGWSWRSAGEAGRAATSFVVRGLDNNVSVLVRVAAKDAVGAGTFSWLTPGAAAVTGSTTELPSDIGISSFQFAPNGRLAELVRETVRKPSGSGTVERLVYRVSGPGRDLMEDVILEEQTGPLSQLVFTSDGKANVIVAGTSMRVFRLEATGWRLVDDKPLGDEFPALLVVRPGADGSLHAVIGIAPTWTQPGSLLYGTNAPGEWIFQVIAGKAEVTGQSYAGIGRHVGLAVSTDGVAHVVFTPEVKINRRPDGFTPFYSELAYASNSSGKFKTEIVERPPDGTGESGAGGSIAIGPNGQPVIAQFFVDSAATGSAQAARLQVWQRKADGGWTKETAASTPDKYALSDGPKFTGYAPLIAFDSAGVPHVAFSDFAARHNPGQEQYVGQIRHAWKVNGRWQVETVYRQSNPLQNTVGLPSLAIGRDSILFSGLVFSGNSLSLVKVARPLGAGAADKTSPAVVSVGLPAAKTYAAGNALTFTVNFTENVRVTGTPALPVTIGTTTRLATYVRGSNSKALVFTAAVQAGDLDTDGIAVGTTLVHDGGTIADTAGNAAAGAVPAVDARKLLVDAVGPRIVAVSTLPSVPLKVGQKITLVVTFSEAVVVRGKPVVNATSGAAVLALAYGAAPSPKTLLFAYTVKKGDPLNGPLALKGQISLPSGTTIRDLVGNDLVSPALAAAPV